MVVLAAFYLCVGGTRITSIRSTGGVAVYNIYTWYSNLYRGVMVCVRLLLLVVVFREFARTAQNWKYAYIECIMSDDATLLYKRQTEFIEARNTGRGTRNKVDSLLGLYSSKQQ